MAMSTPLPAQASLSEVAVALRNLRRPWPKGWPGLPLVFQRAWQQLALGSPRKGSRVHTLQAFGLGVCEQIERDGAQRHARGAEPAYHNRLHIADTLVCMTYLLKASVHAQVPGANAPQIVALALAIMASHDFLHPGGSNSEPAEFESRAVKDLQPLMQSAGLSERDRQDVAQTVTCEGFSHGRAVQAF